VTFDAQLISIEPLFGLLTDRQTDRQTDMLKTVPAFAIAASKHCFEVLQVLTLRKIPHLRY